MGTTKLRYDQIEMPEHGHDMSEITGLQSNLNSLAGSVGTDIATHNAAGDAHSDIRDTVSALATSRNIKNVVFDDVTGDVTVVYADDAEVLFNVYADGIFKDVQYDMQTHEFVFVKDGDDIRISVAHLIDIYTGDDDSYIQVAVSNNKIKAILKAGVIGRDRLTSGLLAEIDAKYEKPSGGIPKADLDAGVQASLLDAEGALKRRISGGLTILYDVTKWYATSFITNDMRIHLPAWQQMKVHIEVRGQTQNGAWILLLGGEYINTNWFDTSAILIAPKSDIGFSTVRFGNEGYPAHPIIVLGEATTMWVGTVHIPFVMSSAALSHEGWSISFGGYGSFSLQPPVQLTNLGHVGGVTGNIQAQLDDKAPLSHAHSDILGAITSGDAQTLSDAKDYAGNLFSGVTTGTPFLGLFDLESELYAAFGATPAAGIASGSWADVGDLDVTSPGAQGTIYAKTDETPTLWQVRIQQKDSYDAAQFDRNAGGAVKIKDDAITDALIGDRDISATATDATVTTGKITVLLKNLNARVMSLLSKFAFGTAAGTICEGNDARLSDARPAAGGDADTVDEKHASDFVDLTSDQTISGTKKFSNQIYTPGLNHTAVINILNSGGSAQGINMGQLLVSNAYADVSLVPGGNGAYVKGQIRSGVATGNAPLIVASNTLVSNLNANMVDGLHGEDLYQRVVHYDQDGDPDTTTYPLLLTKHAHCPYNNFWYIHTLFYNDLTGARYQIAYKYWIPGTAEMWHRSTYHTPVAWSAWKRFATTDDIPTTLPLKSPNNLALAKAEDYNTGATFNVQVSSTNNANEIQIGANVDNSDAQLGIALIKNNTVRAAVKIDESGVDFLSPTILKEQGQRVYSPNNPPPVAGVPFEFTQVFGLTGNGVYSSLTQSMFFKLNVHEGSLSYNMYYFCVKFNVEVSGIITGLPEQSQIGEYYAASAVNINSVIDHSNYIYAWVSWQGLHIHTNISGGVSILVSGWYSTRPIGQ